VAQDSNHSFGGCASARSISRCSLFVQVTVAAICRSRRGNSISRSAETIVEWQEVNHVYTSWTAWRLGCRVMNVQLSRGRGEVKSRGNGLGSREEREEIMGP